MAWQPKPYKLVCPQCGYSRMIAPKSDVLHPKDLISTCPKCKTKMEKKEANVLDNFLSIFK